MGFNLALKELLDKRSNSEADHTVPLGVEVKNKWSCTDTPPICLHDVLSEKLRLELPSSALLRSE
jgi:hypothetical protein